MPACAMLSLMPVQPASAAVYGQAPRIVVSSPATNVVEITRDGEYTSREDVAAYVRKLEDRIQERRSGGEGAPRRLRRRG